MTAMAGWLLVALWVIYQIGRVRQDKSDPWPHQMSDAWRARHQ